MKLNKVIILLVFTLLECGNLRAQEDSLDYSLQNFPAKYFDRVNQKMDKYSKRISDKTEKSLLKLIKWENKVKKILAKTNSNLYKQVFGDNQITFSDLLQRFKTNYNKVEVSVSKYDAYLDRLKSNIDFLEKNKDSLKNESLLKLAGLKNKPDSLISLFTRAENIQDAIKERKELLIKNCYQILKNSSLLKNINKESWYYIETVKNYKEIFSDQDKVENLVESIFQKIPAFQKFKVQNSQLLSMFGLTRSSNNYSGSSVNTIVALSTRAQVNEYINSVGSTVSSLQSVIQKGVDKSPSGLSLLSSVVKENFGKQEEFTELNFRPNTQKTKTFWQRIEYTFDVQFSKNNNLLPAKADIAFGIGYKLDDKRLIGCGIAYKLGLGNIEKIKFSTQGYSMRSFLDWKGFGNFYFSGCYEINYNNYNSRYYLGESDNWQSSALLGVTKKIPASGAFFKSCKLQLLYDFLHLHHYPQSPSLLFRIGYCF